MSRRKIERKLISWLPDSIRLDLIRKKAKIQHAWPSPSFEIRIATTEEELSAAYHLLHDSYVAAGYMDPHPSGMRVIPQHLLPQTTTIVAKWDGKVIGTLSMIRDNPLGLPSEKIFDLSSRRKGGRRIGEVSSLAMDPSFRSKISVALFPLFRFVIQYARHCFGIHEFVVAVNPSSVDMYLALLGFERLESKPKPYDFVKGAPAVGLFLNYDDSDERWLKMYGHLPVESNFHKYWTEIPTNPRNGLPERKLKRATDPILTPDLLKNFFLEKAQLKNTLTFIEMQALLNAYPYPGFHEVISSAMDGRFRNGVRLDVNMKANSEAFAKQGEIWNVSKGGLLFSGKPNDLAPRQLIELKVWLNDSLSLDLSCEVSWAEPTGLYGLRIVNPPAQWLEMIRSLEWPYRTLAKG